MIELLYMSRSDVSVPNGPGVNELQFVLAASREYGQQARFVVPQPKYPLPENFPFGTTIFLPKVASRNPISRLFQQYARVRTFMRLAREYRPEYVVLRSDILPLAEIIISYKAPAIFLKTAGDGTARSFDASWVGKILKPAHQFLRWWLISRSKGIDVVSEIHLRSLEQVMPAARGRTIVIDNAVDTTIFHPRDASALRKELGLDRYRYLIGYIGNLADSRGATELIEAWAHLPFKQDVGLVIVTGDKVGHKALQSLAERVGAANNTHFLGPVPMAEVPDYMSMLDIGVSFRDDDGCSELKVRQYLACGVPVLVSAQVNAFVEAARLGHVVQRAPKTIAENAEKILLENDCVSRQEIAGYAQNHLSYDASMKCRRKVWQERTRSGKTGRQERILIG